MTDAWADAEIAAAIFALDPAALGGVRLRAPPGPLRDRWLALLRAAVQGPFRKLPANVSEDRLLGGIDLPATLAAGAARRMRGALAEADGGVVLLAMAERLPAGTAARVAQAMDVGAVDGARARFGVVLLDEGIDDEQPAAALLDRAAIHLDLTGIGAGEGDAPDVAPRPGTAVDLGEEALEALCGTALALGVGSGRAPLHAARVARAAAALAGRDAVIPEDVALAARLVLAPRATRLPAEAPPEQPDAAEADPPPEREQSEAQGDQPLADQVLEAARAAIPPGLLATLQAGAPPRPRSRPRRATDARQPRPPRRHPAPVSLAMASASMFLPPSALPRRGNGSDTTLSSRA